MTQTFRFDRVEVNPALRALLINGVPAELGARAFDVLHALIKHRSRVVTKNELLELVWPGLVVEENNLQAQVSALRKLLGPKSIVTIPGRGYQFALAETSLLALGLPATSHTASDAVAVAVVLAPTTITRVQNIPSIAVLAFANRSVSADDEYFSDGLADELLNVLMKVEGLQVAARTSAFSFKGKSVTILEIGRLLKVATVLEGSVRKSGNRMRIAVQLVNVADGFQIWSESYDRTLDDIFALQDDIAQMVVKELQQRFLQKPNQLMTSEAQRNLALVVAAAAKGRASNGEAHRLMLHGRFLLNRHGSADLLKSIDYLQQAVALDPGFAQAWAALALALVTAIDFAAVLGGDSTAAALAAAQRAQALEPNLVDGHVAMCIYQTMCAWNWQGAAHSARRALAIAPNDATALREAARLNLMLGQVQQSLAYAERALSLDPLNAICYQLLALPLATLGRLTESEGALRRAVELAPDTPALRSNLAQLLERQGKHAQALDEAQREPANWARWRTLGILYFLGGKLEEADAALNSLIDQHGGDAGMSIAVNYGVRGDAERAFKWLELAYSQRDTGLAYVKQSWALQTLHNDARWQIFLTKMRLAN